MNDASGGSGPQALWLTTRLGDVFNFDPLPLARQQQNLAQSLNNKDFANLSLNDLYAISLDLQSTDAPYEMDLNASFPIGTQLTISGYVLDESERFTVDLRCHEVVSIKHKAERQMRDIPFHMSIRFVEDILVLNSMRDNMWLEEVRYEDFPFFKGGDFVLNIKCEEKCFVISVDTKVFAKYVHRLPPESVGRLKIGGTVRLFKITYQTNEVLGL